MHVNAKFSFVEPFRFGDNFTPLAALTISYLQKAMKMLSYFSKYFFYKNLLYFGPPYFMKQGPTEGTIARLCE